MCELHAHQADDQAQATQGGGRLVDLSTFKRRDMVRMIAAGALFPIAHGCATNPETGRSQIMLVDDSALSRMSLQAWEEQKSSTPVSRDPALNARLRGVGEKIAIASNRQNLPWEFVVFDTPEKNAFVLPGGKVGYYRGLMELSDRDDHIATVVGHEVGHVTGRHAAERFSQGTLAQVGMVAGQVAVGSQQRWSSTERQMAIAALGLGVQVGLLMPWSRQQELEADLLGIDYMHRAGYDVREAIPFWQRMAQSGGARPPELLSTHPDPATRVNAIRQHINNRGYAVV